MDYSEINKLESFLQAEIDARRAAADAQLAEIKAQHLAAAESGEELPNNMIHIGCLNDMQNAAHHYKEAPYNNKSNNAELFNFEYAEPFATAPLFNRVSDEAESVVQKFCDGTQPLIKVDAQMFDTFNARAGGMAIPLAFISDLYYKKAVMEDYIAALEKRLALVEKYVVELDYIARISDNHKDYEHYIGKLPRIQQRPCDKP
jgi:hypothetical protein